MHSHDEALLQERIDELEYTMGMIRDLASDGITSCSPAQICEEIVQIADNV